MKVWIAAALASVLALGGAYAGYELAVYAANLPLTLNQVYGQAWDEACDRSRYICGNYPRANVMYQPLQGDGRAGTYYCRKDVVLIDGSDVMTNAKDFATLVHENVHYLQVMLHGIQCPFQSNDARCLYEHEAWKVGYDVFIALGGDEEDVGNFYDIYQCTKPEGIN